VIRPEAKSTGNRQVVGWTFDTWGRAHVRVVEEGAQGLRRERMVTIPMTEVPGAVAAFERLRVLLEPRLDGAAPPAEPPKSA
jgi:hypothetical protein